MLRAGANFMPKIIEMRAAVCYNGGMDGVSVKSYAKINLSLDITGARGGYHNIDSVVASIDLADEITATARADGEIAVTMSGMGCENLPPERNNAVKAALQFVRRFNTRGADISIRKLIPVGAGLGGSSADVAGVLNALSVLYSIDDYPAVKDIADSVGSDCGYMLRGGFARLTGRGERVCPIDCDLQLYLILALPAEGVSTQRCYALSDVYPAKRRTSAAVQRAICGGQLHELGVSLSNGLGPAAAVINPQIREAYDDLSSLGALGVNMTGSGSAVYALFKDKTARDEALGSYKGVHPALAACTVIPPRYI